MRHQHLIQYNYYDIRFIINKCKQPFTNAIKNTSVIKSPKTVSFLRELIFAKTPYLFISVWLYKMTINAKEKTK